MNTSRVKLSICIPTYNRAIYLKQSLESILIAISDFQNEVEIVISDNASSDATQEMVSENLNKYPFIRYHRNSTNIGGEMNFRFVATLARGNYIWIFGDDDLMLPDAIDIVLRRINKNFNIIVCNYPLWSNDFGTLLRERMLPIRTSMILNDHNDVLKIIGLRLGFISMVIIRRDIYLSLPLPEYESYAEYGFPFLYAVYSGIFNQCHAYIETTPVLMQRGGQTDTCVNKDWWYKCFVIGSSLIFDKLKDKGYARTSVQHAKYLVLKDDVTTDLINRRLNGIEIVGIFSLLLTKYKSQWYFWIVLVPVIYLPLSILKRARRFFGKNH